MTDNKISKDWSKIAKEPTEELNTDAKQEQDPASIAPEESLGILEHPSYKALEDKLTQAELKSHEQWEKAARAIAELENIRQRTKREIENAHKYSLEKFANALLPVVDSLEQALLSTNNAALDDAIKPMREGVELTLKLLVDVLAKFNMVQLDPLGETFNPQLHEAMTTQVDDTVAPGTVLTVFQKGYRLNERLVRPARVIVAKN